MNDGLLIEEAAEFDVFKYLGKAKSDEINQLFDTQLLDGMKLYRGKKLTVIMVGFFPWFLNLVGDTEFRAEYLRMLDEFADAMPFEPVQPVIDWNKDSLYHIGELLGEYQRQMDVYKLFQPLMAEFAVIAKKVTKKDAAEMLYNREMSEKYGRK